MGETFPSSIIERESESFRFSKKFRLASPTTAPITQGSTVAAAFGVKLVAAEKLVVR